MITLSLLLFTILISPVQAKRPGPLDRPLPDYNNLSLRQIFEDGQLVTNPNFDENITGWTGIGAQTGLIWELGQLKYQSVITGWNGVSAPISLIATHKYYIKADVYASAEIISNGVNNIGLYTPNIVSIDIGTISTSKTTKSGIVTALSTATGSIRVRNSASTAIVYWDNVMMFNLTLLGIPTATKIEMDNLYLDYLKYKDMMNATDVMLIVGQLGAFVWSLVVSFEIFGFVLWEYALFGIGAGFIGYLALKIIQKKAGDDNGDSD